MIVEFSLINDIGQEFPVTNVATGFLTNVTGLGGSVKNTYSKIGNTWKQMKSVNEQGEIPAEVVFHGVNAFQKEAEFSAFIRSNRNIKFKVVTPVTTKYLDVDVVSYELKSAGTNTLSCPIKLSARSLWYTNTSQKASIIGSMDDETRYSYRWPSVFNDYSNGYLTFNNDGSDEAAFTLAFHGAISNPKVELDVNGVVKYTLLIPETINNGNQIIWSSVDGNIYCYKGTDAAVEAFNTTGDTSGLTNLVPLLSISNTNFFKFPLGTARLHITANSALVNPIIVSVYKYYRAI